MLNSSVSHSSLRLCVEPLAISFSHSATSAAEWEKLMAKGSTQSLKDEWLTLLFSIPLILAFCGDWGRQIVSDGFTALEAMPEYYQYTLGIIVSSSFAVRSATKFFGKKQ